MTAATMNKVKASTINEKHRQLFNRSFCLLRRSWWSELLLSACSLYTCIFISLVRWARYWFTAFDLTGFFFNRQESRSTNELFEGDATEATESSFSTLDARPLDPLKSFVVDDLSDSRQGLSSFVAVLLLVAHYAIRSSFSRMTFAELSLWGRGLASTVRLLNVSGRLYRLLTPQAASVTVLGSSRFKSTLFEGCNFSSKSWLLDSWSVLISTDVMHFFLIIFIALTE